MNEDSRSAPRSGPSVETIPAGDNRVRLVCPDCGYVEYKNPKIIVGAVCVWQDQFLLCRRAINPRQGFWTMPAGFMELGETTADGARREVREEAGANVEVIGLIGIYEIPRISQVYVIHHARMISPNFTAGNESAEVKLFGWDQIPWGELAFPSVTWALRQCHAGSRPSVQVAPP
jgi:ADP-ribose pyrophosphatase YjhB (NUDIX family)